MRPVRAQEPPVQLPLEVEIGRELALAGQQALVFSSALVGFHRCESCAAGKERRAGSTVMARPMLRVAVNSAGRAAEWKLHISLSASPAANPRCKTNVFAGQQRPYTETAVVPSVFRFRVSEKFALDRDMLVRFSHCASCLSSSIRGRPCGTYSIGSPCARAISSASSPP